MATFSASPAPRRSRPAGNSPTNPARRLRVGSSRPASHRSTPVRPTPESIPFVNGSSPLESGMDVDQASSVFSDRAGRAEILFAKSEEITVAFYANLPVEVRQVLKSADFFGDPYTGDIDSSTGFALLASSRTCFVWQHAQAVKGTPTCYIFACPGSHAHNDAPYHSLVPHGPSREPGLILISISGEVRFWDGIGIGLAGGSHYSTSHLDLGSRETVTNLLRADPQTYIASTSTGQLFRLVLTSSGGKQHITHHPFSRPQANGLGLTRLIPSLWSTSGHIVPNPGNVNAITLFPGTSDVWALVDTRVQKFDMSAEGWEEIILDEDLAGIVRPAIREHFRSAPEDDGSLDLELLDLTVESSGKLVLLASYAGREEIPGFDIVEPRRIYTLLDVSTVSNSFIVESVSSVPYQSTSTSGAPMHPRIQLIQGGSLVCIQFGDAVALCARNSEYQSRLELKSATDRTLGVGVTEDESTLLVLTAATMMRVHVDMDLVAAFDPATGRAGLIKATLMRAIVYGPISENPLHFSFPPEVDEEGLMQGAEQLSQAVLESDPEVVRRSHDLSHQMTSRKERLSWLIGFINENLVLVKMSQRSRQKLAADAEKLYSCCQLWMKYNDLLAGGHFHSVLHEAVYAYMTENGDGHHEDIMRAFFRLRVCDIGTLLPKVVDITAKASKESGRSMATILPEANGVVLTVLQSALVYRDYNLAVYGIELPMIEPWSSTPAIIDAVHEIFFATARFLESADAGCTSSNEPNRQLPQLAGSLFVCMQERLDWLGSTIAASEPGIERERKELGDKFDQLRPDVLETLRRNGHAGSAFELAETFRDFRSLVSLCHKDDLHPPHQNPNAFRIQTYMERFKEDFTTELYTWYIEHGELRVMFSQDDVYSGHLDRFFATHPNTCVSWIHDIARHRFHDASISLLKEAQNAGDLKIKHLMLSIGKLSHLAQLHEAEFSLDQSILDAFHNGLDLISVHEGLITEFQGVLKSIRGRLSLDVQIETVVKEKASKLSGNQLIVFKNLVRQLLQGKVLSVEDAVDALTLKDNTTTVEDYRTALHLLSHDQKLPVARRLSAFRNIWRRIYLHDDWDTIRQTRNTTDAELNERLKATALYTALREVLQKDGQPEGYHLRIPQAFSIPSLSEITSRWPGMSQDQVDAIAMDYQAEAERMAELELDDVYDRIRELAVVDEFNS